MIIFKIFSVEIVDIGSLICILSFWGDESVPTSKVGHSDTVALMPSHHRSLKRGYPHECPYP